MTPPTAIVIISSTLLLSVSGVFAHHGVQHHHIKRQDEDFDPVFDAPPLEDIASTTDAYSENVAPLPTTYTPGSQPTAITGADPIPAFTLVVEDWPLASWTEPPDVNSPEVERWWQEELEGVEIPEFSQTTVGPDGRVTCDLNPEAFAERSEEGRCWWTCGGCTREADLTTCPETGDYGLTFDDGPWTYTPKLLHYLDSVNLKSTFFLIGPRILTHPDTVVYEHMAGHELAVHGWTHTPLTSLTNREIVAELGWTRKAIKDVTGVTPRYMRPPYGDIDDRVRAISLAMGLIPVMWTTIPDGNGGTIAFDSEDTFIHGNQSTAVELQEKWRNTLGHADDLETGFIALQHDLYVEYVDWALGYTMPLALDMGLKPKPVNVCQGRPLGDAYVETNQGEDTPEPAPSGEETSAPSGSRTTSRTGTSIPTGSTGSTASSLQLPIVTGLVTIVGLAFGAMLL